MTIELRNETAISLAQAARMQPPSRLGRPVNPATIFRWIHDGAKGPGGEVIRLEGYRMGGRWLTTIEALERFAARQTPCLENRPEPPRSPAHRRRAAARAEKELEKVGI
jgi:hypothetical protein